MASVTKAYVLCGTLDEAAALRKEIAFFSAIKAVLLKHTEDEKNSALKRLLRKYKYPPEGQEEAVTLVLQQAEALADAWSLAS